MISHKMELPGWFPAMLVALTHILWSYGSWFIGHFIYLMIFGCTNDIVKECHLTNFASEDFIALLTLIIGSTIYFRLAQYVLSVLYEGKLPIENANKILESFVKPQGNRKQRRKIQKIN